MINIIIRKLKEQKMSVLYYALGLFIYAWSLIALYPTLNQKMNFQDYLSAFPEEMMAFFGAEADTMGTIEGFLSFEYLAIFFILILAFYAASSAGSTIAGAIEKKIIDFNLSQPISRTKLLIAEAIVSTKYIIGLVVFNSLVIWATSKFYDVDISNKGLIALTILAVATMLSIYGIAILFSSFLKSKIIVVTTTVFLVLALYIFQSLTLIVDKLKDFDKVTIFYLYKPQEALTTGEVNLNHIAILISIYLIGTLSALIVFNKKDI